MKINFTSFLVTEGLIYAAIVAALVGLSGCGKSTIFRLLLRFMRQRRARSSSMGFHWKKSVSGSFISTLLFWSSTLAGCDRILKMVEARK